MGSQKKKGKKMLYAAGRSPAAAQPSPRPRWRVRWRKLAEAGSAAAAPSSPAANRRDLGRADGCVRRARSRGRYRWPRRSVLVAGAPSATRGCGGGQRARRRRFRRKRGVPAGDLRRGGGGGDGAPRGGRRSERGGAEGRRAAAAATAELRLAREREGEWISAGVFAKKPSNFSVIASRSLVAMKCGLRVRFTVSGGLFLQKRHGRVRGPSDRRRTARIGAL